MRCACDTIISQFLVRFRGGATLRGPALGELAGASMEATTGGGGAKLGTDLGCHVTPLFHAPLSTLHFPYFTFHTSQWPLSIIAIYKTYILHLTV